MVQKKEKELIKPKKDLQTKWRKKYYFDKYGGLTDWRDKYGGLTDWRDEYGGLTDWRDEYGGSTDWRDKYGV